MQNKMSPTKHSFLKNKVIYPVCMGTVQILKSEWSKCCEFCKLFRNFFWKYLNKFPENWWHRFWKVSVFVSRWQHNYLISFNSYPVSLLQHNYSWLTRHKKLMPVKNLCCRDHLILTRRVMFHFIKRFGFQERK